MTEHQVKIVRTLVVAMVGLSIYQAFVIRRLTNRLNFGRDQFNKVHNISTYVLEILEKNDIELTEFDVIALTQISEGTWENNA